MPDSPSESTPRRENPGPFFTISWPTDPSPGSVYAFFMAKVKLPFLATWVPEVSTVRMATER